MFRFSTLTIFALAAGFVAAQTPTNTTTSAATTPSISACVLTCSTSSLSAGNCTGITDLQCVCTNPAYQQAVQTCLTTNCTADDAANAVATQEQLCASVSSAPSGTGASSTSGTAAPSSPAISSGSASSKPTTSGTPTANASASKSSAPASTTGAAFKNAPVAGAMGALAALIGAAVF